MANNWQLGMLAGLDSQSRNQLNQDIKAIQKTLNSVELKATLNPNQIKSLESQLNKLQVSLTDVTIPKSVLDGLVSQINTALSGIQIPNISLGGQTANQAKQAGQQIGDIVSQEVANSLDKITSKEIGIAFKVEETDSDEFNRAVDEEIKKLQQAKNKLTSVRYTTNTEQRPIVDIFGNVTDEYEHVEKLTGAVFRYNTETGEAITKTMKWAQIGTTVNDNGDDVPLMGWVQGLTTYNKSLEETTVKTDNFIDKRKKAVSDFEIDLQKIQSRVADQGVGKPIKDQSHIDALETQYNEVNNAIKRLDASTKDTFTDTRIEVEKAIATLENLERQYRNAETTATSLRSKDIATVKSQYSSKLDVLVEKMQSSGVYSNGFQKGADNLRSVLSNATDSTGLTQFLNGLDKLEAGYKRAKASADAFNQSQKVGIKVSGLESSISDLQRISPEIDKFEADINGAKVTIKSLGEDLSKVSTQSDFSVVNEKWKAFTKAAQSAGIAITEVATKSDSLTEKVNKIQLSFDDGTYEAKYDSLIAKTKQWVNANNESVISTQKLTVAYNEFNTAASNYANDNSIANRDTLIQKEEELARQIKATTNEVRSQNAEYAKSSKIDSLHQKIQEFYDKNTATHRTWRSQLKNMLNETAHGAQVTATRVNEIEQEFLGVSNAARQAGKLGQSFFNSIKEQAKKFTQWASLSGLIMQVANRVRTANTELKEMNSILTEISKTNDSLSKTDLAQIGDNAFEKASKYGKTATDYLTGVQEMSRAGYDNAEEMAELTTAVQGAGDMTAELANSYVIATDKAYQMNGSVQALTKTLDGANNITNNNAVNMTELAEGMSVVGSQAASSQMSVEQTTAAIGTLVAVTQQGGSEMGNAFKGILMNLQQVTGEIDGEEIDTESLTKYEKACAELGISLSEVKDGVVSLKEPMQILKELSVEYQKLDDSDAKRANLLSAVGGKYRANALNALLENYDLYEKMLQDYAAGSGSMMQEAEKSANNWEGSLNRLNNTINNIISNVENSDFIIGTINSVNDLLELVNKLTSSLGSLGTIGLGAGLFASFKGTGIFKTINGDLTLFNKTLIAIKDNLRSLETVNATVYNKHGVFNLEGLTTSATKSVGTFTKLSNAFKVYNGNLSKSTQLQTAYIKAVGNQNHALGNYLAGLNGANASMGGYIKSLIGAKAATIGLQVASVALNATITMGISLAISAFVTQIQKWANAQEDARKKSVELTNSYKEQQSSLESQIEKYKELKDTLDDGNLSTDEARSIKEQLLEIQQSLIESYGDEASNIDLVNGKYREQLGLLGELSKEKATEYVTENRDVFADAKEALEKERTYNLGTVTNWNDYSPQTEDQKKLLDYIEAYSELLDLTYTGATGRGVSATSVSVSVKADVASADELMHQFATDLEKYGQENDIDVSGILEGISGQLKETWTDELTEYKTVYDEFMKAEIVRNDTLRPLYQESIQAVEDYNKALSTGEGIEEAKANLESVQQSVQSATGELEGSQGVFDGIYGGINKDAEAAYNLGKAFENDKTVQNYAEQLRGLTDIDLKAINFNNDNTEKGEEAFKGLMETLGLTEEQVQSLINKLVELGYVQGEVQGSTLDNEITALFDDIFSLKNADDTLTNLGKISEAIDTVQNAYKTLDDAIDEYNENGSFSIDTLQSVIGLGDDWLKYLVDEEGNFSLNKEALQELTRSRLEDMRIQAINNLIDNVGKIENETQALKYLTEANYDLGDSYEYVAAKSLQLKLRELENKGISSGTISKIAKQSMSDMQKINDLFRNVSLDTDGSLGGSGSSGSSSGSSSSEDNYRELVDFFERRIEVLNDANSLLEKNLENVVGSFAKNNLIGSQLSIAEEKYRNYTDAISMYSDKAGEALSKLPADIAEKVKNGSVSMTDFIGSGNEDVVEAINDYQDWANKIADCKEELAALKETIRDLELAKFNNIIEDYTNQFDLYEDANDLLGKQISLLEEAGELIGESFYSTQIEESQKQLSLLEEEKAALVNQLNSSLASGRIQAGTDEWLEMVNALSDVDGSILDCKTSIEELDNALLDLHTQVFERIQEQFSSLNSELENLFNLFDEDADVTNGNRNWTDEAVAQLGLLAQQYELSRYQVQQYDKEIEQLNADYLNGKYSATEYADKLADLSSAQWDAVNSSEAIKDSIVDLNKTRVNEIIEGIEEEIDAYRELADSKIEALDAEKDLKEYRDSIAEKSKSITDLEKQIAAMQYDDTAATVAKRLQLEEQLAEAKKELEDAEYDHSIESQKNAINQQYEDYETARNEEIKALEESLKDKETLIYNSFETVKKNSNIVGGQIATIATQHGVKVSNSLISAWKSGENAIASYGTTLSQKSSAFIGNIIDVESEIWSLQNKANETANTLSYMFSTQADTLVNELEQSYYSEYNLANMTSALQSSLVNTLERGYDISNIVNAMSTISDSARGAESAFNDLSESLSLLSTPKWYVVDKNGTILSRGYDTQGEATSKIGFTAGGVGVKQYAKGTRNAEGGLRVVNEKGYELVLPKLSSGNYEIGNAGDQILTKAQTDNIFDWAKINPSMFNLDFNIPNVPFVQKSKLSPVSINYDSLIHVDGDVNNSNIRQIEAAVEAGIKKLSDDVNRNYRYRKR